MTSPIGVFAGLLFVATLLPLALSKSERQFVARKIRELDRSGRHMEASQLYQQLLDRLNASDSQKAA